MFYRTVRTFLFLFLILSSQEAFSKGPPKKETEEKHSSPFRMEVIPRFHVGLAFRLDFEEEPPNSEPFLVAGPGLLLHLRPRIGFMASLTFAMAPTGTFGPGLTTEWEFLVHDHVALDLAFAVYTETSYHDSHHWDVITAIGGGVSYVFSDESMLTFGVQGGMNPTLYAKEGLWGWNIYPVIELALRLPHRGGGH